MFFTVVRILSLNCLNKLEDFKPGGKCTLYAPTILTQQQLNIISNLSKMLRGCYDILKRKTHCEEEAIASLRDVVIDVKDTMERSSINVSNMSGSSFM